MKLVEFVMEKLKKTRFVPSSISEVPKIVGITNMQLFPKTYEKTITQFWLLGAGSRCPKGGKNEKEHPYLFHRN